MDSRTTTAPRSPGRPRSSEADQAILAAVLDLLSEGIAPDALSVEAVAARAGVGKSTIYRRWPTKHELLVAAVQALKGEMRPFTGESVRHDLIDWLTAMIKPSETHSVTSLPCLVPFIQEGGEYTQVYQEFVEPRREAVREVLRRGIRTGEVAADLDLELALQVLAGPVLTQKMLRWNPAIDDATLPTRVVDAFLCGIGRPAATSR